MEEPMNYQEILYGTDGPIGTLTLNNPARANALSKRMVRELASALQQIGEDETVRVVILKAEGKHFCAGHDLTEMTDRDVREYRFIFGQCSRMMQQIHHIPQPVIAQVQGVATAAGCQLVAACDLALAEAGARFATPGVKIGLFCTTPAVALSRCVGRKAALEMLRTGRFFSAQEAREIGLINRVVQEDRLGAETTELAAQIAEASRFVVGIGKRAFYAQIEQAENTAYAMANDTVAMNLCAQDAQNGIKAFLSKSRPEWKNR
jgi:enoyl-CoA hydratase/carnithine racemase